MNFLNTFKKSINTLFNINHKIDYIREALGRIEERQVLSTDVQQLRGAEFKVYSQWGEDGIIQFLISKVDLPNKIFLEFGVENYTESNTRFLLVDKNWSGLIIDSSKKNIQYIKNDPIYWRYNIKAECSFITKDNINNVIQRNGISGDIGILSIDIDGNDYWVWDAIDCIEPRIVICEYNSFFGCRRKLTIPYDENFIRTKAHFSNLYYGASIYAFHSLALQKGYSLVGSNSAGNNLFFVKNEYLANLPILSPEEAYVESNFREGRDIDGNLTFLNFKERMDQIGDMKIFDIDKNSIIKIKDIE